MVELEDLVFTPGLLPFWRKSIFHNGPGSLRLLWPRANDILAASCMSGQILFWNVVSAQTVGSIDGLRDIQTARHWHEMFSAINTRGVKTGRGMRKRNLPVMSQLCVIDGVSWGTLFYFV